jgi:hypothetical protein
MVAVTTIVTGAVPQLNVMTPPLVTAVFSKLNVQLAADPVPISDVGLDTSTGCAPAGRAVLHLEVLVAPAVLVAPPVPGEPPVAALPPVALDPPVDAFPPVALPPVDVDESPPVAMPPPVAAGALPPVDRLPPLLPLIAPGEPEQPAIANPTAKQPTVELFNGARIIILK